MTPFRSRHARAWQGVAATSLLLAVACSSSGSQTSAAQTPGGLTGATSSTAETTGEGLRACDEALPFADRQGLICADGVEGMLDSPSLKIIDIRGADAFAAGHLPRAQRLDPALLRATVDGVEGQVAATSDIEDALAALGLTPELDVVIYDDSNTTGAARLEWTLAYLGHRGRVWMLDGGYQPWLAQGRATEHGAAPTAPTVTYAAQLDLGQRVDAAWVLDHLEDPNVVIFDARTEKEFAAGHIPGAVNVNWQSSLAADGSFLPNEELRARYGDIQPGNTLINYCQSGSRASVNWLILSALGFADVRVYDGSWAEWGANSEFPQEQ